MLPDGWIETALEGHVRIHSGSAPADLRLSGQGMYPYVKVEDLNNCDKFQMESRQYLHLCRSVIPANSVIFPKRGAAIFGNKVRIAGRPMVLDTNLMAVEVLDGIDAEFFYYAISYAGLHRLADISTIPQLNNKHIYPHRLARPAIDEQRRIARILSTWDQAISNSEKLLLNSKKQKQALVEELLFMPCKRGRWSTRQIAEVADRVQRRNTSDEQLPVLMISSGVGFVRQDEKYGRYMAGKSVENYILLKAGEFAYNKGNSKRFEFGCVFPLMTQPRGLVPHVYVCFRLKESGHARFFEHLFAADYLHDQLGAMVNTGVRNNGLLNIRPDDFMACRVPVPPIEEQQRIADVLKAATSWIDQHERSLAQLLQERAALMAQLLTGKRRVRMPAAGAAP